MNPVSDQRVTTLSTESSPLAGRLLWISPAGVVRELDPDRPTMAHDCTSCADPTTTQVLVREHLACGHVTYDGFVPSDRVAHCPKCEEAPPSMQEMPAVGQVHICTTCDTIADQTTFHPDSA